MSGVLRFLTPPIFDGRGYVAQAINLPALLDFLDRQLIVEYDGIFRRGFMHREHRDVGPRRLDYRTDRGTFGDGSLQVVVSRVTGAVFFDMDAFSPYEDITSFVGHSWEVVRNRFRRRK